jgi:hypothetical protein
MYRQGDITILEEKTATKTQQVVCKNIATMASGKQQMSGIVNPHDNDVLSGRGNFVNYHAGNEHFRALVRKHKVAYVQCPKPQKGKFSRMIVDEVKTQIPPGRFLKQDMSTKLWYDIGEKKSLDKTRQALREGAPEIMKEVIVGEEDDSGDEAVDHLGAVNQVRLIDSYMTSVETSWY